MHVVDPSFDRICAERLTLNLISMACQLNRHDGLGATRRLLDQQAGISICTMLRRLNRIRPDQSRFPGKKPEMKDALLVFLLCLPFAIKEMEPDKGSAVHRRWVLQLSHDTPFERACPGRDRL